MLNGNKSFHDSVHAESDAISDWLHKKRHRRTEAVDVFVVRLAPTVCRVGSPDQGSDSDVPVTDGPGRRVMMSRPCKDCIERLVNAGLNVKRVHYSTRDGTIATESFEQLVDSLSSTKRSKRQVNGPTCYFRNVE
eukprot:GFYU01004563.1.p1 GENE.GFYU01004563.1~~GFYU01004563.1.p1  ORF type:complete len:135 (-),score=6.47 GFYU01004563.1:18-422(-)